MPILLTSGAQCTTVEEVDATVQDFWVRKVWRKNVAIDAAACWQRFQQSCFFPFIPHCSFPHEPWTLDRIKRVLSQLREGSAPGLRGFPISLWKSLPDIFLTRLADLLNLVEKEGSWPDELLHAYVAMIPKASGGSRPQDQRPITVLDVAYRVWAKGIVMCWASVLNTAYLGPAVMGFRAQSGTLHLAQLLSDLIALQNRRQQPLWLVSFDVEKCFPSLPWWGLFGVLAEAGVDSRTVQCLRSFYQHLRHRFRYGQLDGSEWSMANGLAQGCPASPDLLNILFEPFHCWAAAQNKGVSVAGTHVASASFADDVTLVATSWEEVEFLVAGYCLWCNLLDVSIHPDKTQIWANFGPVERSVELTFGSTIVSLQTSRTFRVVGIELGANERRATSAHFTPRLTKALRSGKRLVSMEVPAAVAAQMWRTTILPQALYGCEVRNITKGDLKPLHTQGKMVVTLKAPLELSNCSAAEITHDLPLGTCAVRDARLEVLARRLRWALVLGNQVSLVGTVHRE